MRASILAGTLSAILTMTFLRFSHQGDATWMLMYGVSIVEEPAFPSRTAHQFSRDALAMEFEERMDEADYLYVRAVRVACEEYGLRHPITESYRRRYQAFIFKLHGISDSAAPVLRIEPALGGLVALGETP